MEDNQINIAPKTSEAQAKPTTATTTKPANPHKLKNILTILLVILLVGAAPAAYFYRDNKAKSDLAKKQGEITELQKKIADQEAKKAAVVTISTDKKETSQAPSASDIENIKASITSSNTAALEGYMAATVRVILAASEGVGDRTPTQAIADLSYLDSATDPWNFDLPVATLTGYRDGTYASYFPETAVVGKSANNYVVSFTFNSGGKISGIFVTPSDDLL